MSIKLDRDLILKEARERLNQEVFDSEVKRELERLRNKKTFWQNIKQKTERIVKWIKKH